MNESWYWRGNVPAEVPLSTDDWRILRQRFGQFQHRLFWSSALAVLPVFMVYMIWKLWIEKQMLGGRLDGWLGFGEMLIVYIGAQGWMAWVLRRKRGKLVREIVRELGYELCLNCGHWLRGLHHDTRHCPECGSPRQRMRQPLLSHSENTSS